MRSRWSDGTVQDMVMIDNRSAQHPGRNELAISRGWVQGVALVFIFGFFVMGVLAYRTYTASMPQPQQVVSEAGEVVYTGEDITSGQNIS